MSESSRRKKLLNPGKHYMKEAPLQRRKGDLLLQMEKVKKEIWALENQSLDLFGELGEVVTRKNAQGKTLLDLLTDTGIHRYLLQSKALTAALEEFYKSELVFISKDRSDDKQGVILRALSNFIYKWLIDNDFDHEGMLQKTLISVGFEKVDSNIAAVVAGYVVAREVLLQKMEEGLSQKYLSNDEMMGLAKETFGAYLESYESHLTGEALRVKEWIDKMPPHLRIELDKSFDEPMAKADFKAVVSRSLQDIGSLGTTGEEQARAFEKLFEHIRTNLGEEQGERDTLSYLITQKVFRERRDKVHDELVTERLKNNPNEFPAWKKDPYEAPKNGSTLWTDEQLTLAGMNLWEKSYKLGEGDDFALQKASEAGARWGEQAKKEGFASNEAREVTVTSIIQFAGKWAVHAFQRITTTHTYAAALMCSDADRAVLDDIEMQWHAFMVCLPNGLLKYTDENDGSENEYNRVLVSHYEHMSSIILLNQTGVRSSHRIVLHVAANIAELLDVKDVEQPKFVHTESDISGTTQQKVQRIVILAKRLVTGLLLALQDRNNFKSKVYPAREGKHPRDAPEPEHRVVFVGAPLKIDCRPAIADYIQKGSHRRKGAPPQVQTLVRGHYKRQVCGVMRLGRKVIWISPFWRGPEDAPILTRPKHVGP